MKTIFKYPIKVEDEQIVMLPINAQILTVQTQHETPCIWALIDKNENRTTPVKVKIYGTGHPIPDSENLTYIGTFQLYGGNIVFHVFHQL